MDDRRLTLSEDHVKNLTVTLPLIERLIVADRSNLILGGGTFLAMHWQDRISTDLDFVIAENGVHSSQNLREQLETLVQTGDLRAWRLTWNTSVMLDTPLGKLSFVFEGVGNCPETEEKTHLGIPCKSPISILRKKLLHRVVRSGRLLTRDFYDFAWAATRHSDLWQQASKKLIPEQRAAIVGRCQELEESRREQRAGPPITQPADLKLARNVWRACIEISGQTRPECIVAAASATRMRTLR